MEQFKVGMTYMTRSIGDHNCIITADIVSRTTKTVTARIDGTSKPAVFRLSEYEGKEQFYPWGRHSMCPIIDAADTKVLRRDWEH